MLSQTQETKHGITSLSSDFIGNLGFVALWYLFWCTLLSFVIALLYPRNSPYSIYFVAAIFTIESIFREKNLLYKIKSGFIRELAYYIAALVPTLILYTGMLFFVSQSQDKIYEYLIGLVFIFMPVVIAYIGSKLKII